MTFDELIQLLTPHIDKVANIDDIEMWKLYLQDLPAKHRKYVFEFAEPKWIERKINDGSLLLHPKAKNELINRKFKPLKRHRQMIYASLIVSYDKVDSKAYYRRLKDKIVKKHNSFWWKGVQDRLKPTYAARLSLLEQNSSTGHGLKYSATKSVFIGQALQDEVDRILSRLPAE